MPTTVTYPATSTLLSGILDTRKKVDVDSGNAVGAQDPSYIRRRVYSSTQVFNGVPAGITTGKVLQIVDESLMDTIRKQQSILNEYKQYKMIYDDLELSVFGQKSAQQSFYHSGRVMADMLNTLAANPDAGKRLQAINALNSHVKKIVQGSAQIQTLRSRVDQDISLNVSKMNELVGTIASSNSAIKSNGGGDVSVYENQRRAALQELSGFLDISPVAQDDGQITVYTKSNNLLVVGNSYATFKYSASTTVTATSTLGNLTLDGFGSTGSNATVLTTTAKADNSHGTMKALLKLRDDTLPGLQEMLDAYTEQMRDQFNAIHNLGTSSNPPNILTGTIGIPGNNNALNGNEAISGTGTLRVGILDSTTGKLVTYCEIDLTGMTKVNDLVNAIETGTGVNTGSTFLTASISTGALVLTAKSPYNTAQYGITLGSVGASAAKLSLGSSYDASISYGASHFFGLNNLLNTGTGLPGDAVIHGIASNLSIRDDIITSSGRNLALGALSNAATGTAELLTKPALLQDDTTIIKAIAEKSASKDSTFRATTPSDTTSITSLDAYASMTLDIHKVIFSNNLDDLNTSDQLFRALTSQAHAISGVDLKDVFFNLQALFTQMSVLTKAIAKVQATDEKLIDLL